jgi:hypothetical protein
MDKEKQNALLVKQPLDAIRVNFIIEKNGEVTAVENENGRYKMYSYPNTDRNRGFSPPGGGSNTN